MRGKLAISLMAVALSGCGQADQAINDSFDREFSESCVASARGGLTEELATKACDCALARINEQYSATEKIALTDEQAMPIAQQCFAEVMGPAQG